MTLRWHTLAICLVAFVLLSVAGCSKTPSEPATCSTLSLGDHPARIVFTGLGQTLQLTASAFCSDGERDVTSQTAWTSSNAQVLAVSSAGLVTAVSTGRAQVRATYKDLTVEQQFDVSVGADGINLTGTWDGTATYSTGEVETWRWAITHFLSQTSGTATIEPAGQPPITLPYSGVIAGGHYSFVMSGAACSSGTLSGGVVTISNGPLSGFINCGSRSGTFTMTRSCFPTVTNSCF